MRDHVKGGALTEVSFFVLLALYSPRHGYGIMKFIEEQTGGRLSLGAGTLYGALSTMEEKGWIRPLGEESGRKKKYGITALGRAVAERERERLEQLVCTARNIMEGETQE